MSAVADDPIAALLAAGEGRFEWERGKLVEAMPPSFEHDQVRGFLHMLMGSYVSKHKAGVVTGEAYFERLEPDLIRAPDLAFFRTSSLDRIRPNFSVGGADLIVEIVSPDSRTRDRRDKLREYEAAGVEEYWIVDAERGQAEFFRLRDGRYEPVEPDAEGRVHSSALPGFFVRVEWLWRRDLFAAYRELGVF